MKTNKFVVILRKILEHFGSYYHPWYRYKDTRRFLFLYDLFKKIPADGDIVECGVGEGRSIVAFGAFVRYEDKTPRGKTSGYLLGTRFARKVIGYDTFEGFPYGDKKGYFSVPIAQVQKTIMYHGAQNFVSLIKGSFEETLPHYEGKIALLHIDADLGQAYIAALKNLYEKVLIGGVIIFDEYKSEKWDDVKSAVDAFLKSINSEAELKFFDDKAYFIKK